MIAVKDQILNTRYTFEDHIEQLYFKFGERGNRVVGVADDDSNMATEAEALAL